jgi:hypothetical protein
MNVAIPEGSTLRLMTADPTAALQAIRTAIKTANHLAGEGAAGVGMLFLDVGWFELFRTRPAKLLEVVQEEAGEIPCFSVATLGQIWRESEDGLPVAANLGALAVVFKGES